MERTIVEKDVNSYLPGEAVAGQTAVTSTMDSDQSVDEIRTPLETLWKTKEHLYQISDGRKRIELLKRRIALREETDALPDGSVNTDELHRMLVAEEQDVKRMTVILTDLLGRVRSANHQMILVKRYVDLKTWEQIAIEMDMTIHAIHKHHGKALLTVHKILMREEENRCGERREDDVGLSE